MLSTVLGGANFVLHAAGWLEGGLATGYEKLVLDADRLGAYEVVLRGFATDDDALGADAYADVEPGGHFLGSAHTLVALHERVLRSGAFRFEQRRAVGRARAARTRRGARSNAGTSCWRTTKRRRSIRRGSRRWPTTLRGASRSCPRRGTERRERGAMRGNPCEGRDHRRRRRRLLDPLSSRQVRLEGRHPARAQRADQRLVLARGRPDPHHQLRPQHLPACRATRSISTRRSRRLPAIRSACIRPAASISPPTRPGTTTSSASARRRATWGSTRSSSASRKRRGAIR